MCCGLTVLFVSLALLKLNLNSEFFLLEKIIIIINLFKKIFPMFYHFATLHYSCHLQHIAGNIVDHDIRPKEILQSSFDLLGELIKFNIEAFRLFEKVFVTKAKVSFFGAVPISEIFLSSTL